MIRSEMFAQSRSRPKHEQFVSQLFPHYIYQIVDFREWVVCLEFMMTIRDTGMSAKPRQWEREMFL